MRRTIDRLKTITLILAMALGFWVQGPRAHAQAHETLVVAGGCFWCVEADFEKLPGVLGAVSGYTGGQLANPTYKQVTAGGTGHYEAVEITFDPAQISRRQLLDMFLRSIDPTDDGGQFCDRGASYRSAIFVANPGQRQMAQQAIAAAETALGVKVVTPVLPATQFWPAEAYHQDYYKGQKLVLTRFGPLRQAKAYERYRQSCGRDQRVKALWGSAAAFAK